MLYLLVMACSSFWIAKLSTSYASRSVNHHQGGYVHDLWGDTRLSLKGLAGCLLRDGSWLGEDVFRHYVSFPAKGGRLGLASE